MRRASTTKKQKTKAQHKATAQPTATTLPARPKANEKKKKQKEKEKEKEKETKKKAQKKKTQKKKKTVFDDAGLREWRISSSALRAQLAEVLEQVGDGDVVVVERRGKPPVALLSADQLLQFRLLLARHRQGRSQTG